MSNHVVKYHTTPQGDHYATCNGGGNSRAHWASGYYAAKQTCEDEFRLHMKDVEIARASLGTSTPSLASQRDHYRKMQDDPHTSQRDRALWKQLADEIDKRLGEGTPHPADEHLW